MALCTPSKLVSFREGLGEVEPNYDDPEENEGVRSDGTSGLVLGGASVSWGCGLPGWFWFFEGWGGRGVPLLGGPVVVVVPPGVRHPGGWATR